MMFDAGSAIFTFEIMVAELIFLFSADRRSRFPLRICLILPATLGLSFLFSMPQSMLTNTVFQLLRFIALFSLTVMAMWGCFKLRFPAVLSACVSGYALQHMAYQITALVANSGLYSDASVWILTRQNLLELTVFPPVYLVIFLSFGISAAKFESHKKTDWSYILVSVAIVFICVGLSRFSRYFGDFGSVSVCLYAITCCLLALIVQFVLYRNTALKLENTTVNLLWQEDRKQYELSKKTIDAFNIKYHDLKHKLANLKGVLPDEEIAALTKAARVYGSRIKTGNEALDVLLTENSLRCSEENITLTYMGNGADLGFMNVMDVYSLFGNAVDNAIEAVRKLDDPEKKLINIVTERMGDIISVDITNYFSGEMTIEDGLPVTTKPDRDFHGFGMKSMRLIAEKYGGRLSAESDGDLFSLGIYLMAPEEGHTLQNI